MGALSPEVKSHYFSEPPETSFPRHKVMGVSAYVSSVGPALASVHGMPKSSMETLALCPEARRLVLVR